jgi:hypothetical protein
MTNAHPLILDRETPARQVAEHFSKTVWLLQDLVNYGSNLIPRCFESSNKTAIDVVILVALAKQAVTHLDGFEIHVSHGAILASHLSARALLEASLYVSWVLQSDTERRARQYYVWNLRQNRAWGRRLVPGTTEHAAFTSSLQATPSLPDLASLPAIHTKVTEAQNQIAAIDQQLALPVYKAINDEFDRIKRSTHDLPWHAPWGAKSIRQMADQLNRLAEYDLFYSTLSDVAHSSAFRKHVSIDGVQVNFEPIRQLESIDTVCRPAVGNALRLYRELLGHYRPGELENLSRKYQDEWRTAFLTMPGVNYRTDPLSPP